MSQPFDHRRRSQLRAQVVGLVQQTMRQMADGAEMPGETDEEDEYCREHLRILADKLRAGHFIG